MNDLEKAGSVREPVNPSPEVAETEKEALAFCVGIGHGLDERSPVERYPFRTCEAGDLPFIEAIENY